MVELLELTDRKGVIGFQADMAHTLLYTLGHNAPEDRLLPEGYDWKDRSVLDAAYTKLTAALRPWTFDFHIAQNDATVLGSGSHDKTGPPLPAEGPQRQARHHAPRGLLAARREEATHARDQPHVLGWLHVPQQGHGDAADLERHPRRHAQGARRARLVVVQTTSPTTP
jgi:hypothetical protein